MLLSWSARSAIRSCHPGSIPYMASVLSLSLFDIGGSEQLGGIFRRNKLKMKLGHLHSSI